jgi:hypothetical protein
MVKKIILDLTDYKERYGLSLGIAEAFPVDNPALDIERPGLMMHGSEADPYPILLYGLIPQSIRGQLDDEWQVCIGLNAKDWGMSVNAHHARKNSAIKYAGYFSDKGIIYVLDDSVRATPGFREYWDNGSDGRGYAWVKTPIKSENIMALITENIGLAAAALIAANRDLHIYRPDGRCIRVKRLDI